MTKIALFGTSADPPTSGHQTILKWLSQHFDWVVVWAADNPLKVHQTPLEHRSTMLRLLISDIEPSAHNIGLYPDLSRSRTLETIELARTRWPDDDFTLVIGADLITQITRWYRVKELLQQVEILVIPRPGYEINTTGLETLKLMGATVAIANFKPPDVSSTAYREEKNSDALTPQVEAYIHSQKLYKC